MTQKGSINKPVSNLSNVASLLWHAYKSLPEPSNSVNWAGTFAVFNLPLDPECI